MKTLLFTLLFFATLCFAQAQESSRAIINHDTLYYNWEIKSYNVGIKQLPFFDKIYYSNGIWLNALEVYYSNYSDNNLESWTRAPYVPVKGATDFTATKNKAFVIGDSSGKGSWGLIAETNDIRNGWTVKTHDIFKNVYIRKVAFKDESTGIISSAYDLYRTEDGGQSWKKAGNFSSFFNGDSVFIDRFLNSDECDLLIAVVHSLKDVNPYLMFSKDYGKSWVGPRPLPVKTYSRNPNPATSMSFYMRNDSLWLSGFIERYEYIYFTSDLGSTWQTQYQCLKDPLSSFSSIQFFDNSLVGVATENNPFVYLTFDGGNHWVKLSDSVALYGGDSYINPEDTNLRDLKKYQVVKAENKMYFFGWNKVFKFNNLNVPSGVNEEKPDPVYCEFNNRSQSIDLQAKPGDVLVGVELYDESGRELYQARESLQSQLQIPRSAFGGANVVFAIVRGNGEVFLKKLLCR
ncbi:MAG: sialidase family protein [Chloroflexota bacterium]